MPDWSIKIVSAEDGEGAAFVPDLKGAQPGDPLRTMQDDLVTWNNTTDETHQPWPTNSEYLPYPDSQVQRGTPTYLSDPIDGGESSRPSYDVSQPADKPSTWTVYYCCKLHPDVDSEHGTIIGSTY